MKKIGQHAITKRQLLNAEVVGWYGAIAIIAAYLLVSFDFLSVNDAFYQLLNLTGAIGIIVISWVKRVRQSVILNLFWSAIAIAALIKLAT